MFNTIFLLTRFRLNFLSLSFFLATFFFACQSSLAPKFLSEKKREFVAREALWVNYASFLAGMSSGFDSPDLQSHKRLMDEAWGKIEEQTRKPIASFLQREGLSFSTKTVLYPFSGTDVLNLFSFFPNADYYICFGLESATVPDSPPSSLPDGKKNLSGIQVLSKFLAERNYFTYRVMREEMQSGKLEGAFPVYLAFLTRLGYQIYSVEPLELERKMGNQKQKIFGFRLHFYDPKSNKSKQLDYWKIFLVSGDSLGQDRAEDPLAQYFEGLGKKAVFQKSAEYLFHGDSRKYTRELFLKSTDLIVQDDSGFPLRFFPEEEWNRKIFGSYDKSWLLSGAVTPENQPELLAFKNANPLPFPFGYGVLAGKEKQRSLLMVIQRK